ncbi:hypothetical protein [Ottowia caeni]|uniref:hypothetical protein n=1 Tax=Ottowia caeni TaxID=2870339 RepID=UPI003D75C658
MLGSVLCEYLGVKPRFNASVVSGGASPAAMLKHAAEAIVSGLAETFWCAQARIAPQVSHGMRLWRRFWHLGARISSSPMGARSQAIAP